MRPNSVVEVMHTPLSRISLTKSCPSFSKPITEEEAVKTEKEKSRDQETMISRARERERERGQQRAREMMRGSLGDTVSEQIDKRRGFSSFAESIHNIPDSEVDTMRQSLATDNKLERRGDEKIQRRLLVALPSLCSHNA
jgi:hypothetical protein